MTILGLLVACIVSVAAGADMGSLAVARLEAGNTRPDVLDIDREEHSAGLDWLGAGELEGFNAVGTEESIDAAGLPVARVAGIDEDDRMEIAREPQRGGEWG